MKNIIIIILVLSVIICFGFILGLSEDKKDLEMDITLNKTFADGFNRGQFDIIIQQTTNRELYFFNNNRTQKISIDKLCGG